MVLLTRTVVRYSGDVYVGLSSGVILYPNVLWRRVSVSGTTCLPLSFRCFSDIAMVHMKSSLEKEVNRPGTDTPTVDHCLLLTNITAHNAR